MTRHGDEAQEHFINHPIKKTKKPEDAASFSALVGTVAPVKARRRVFLGKFPPSPRATFARADERAVLAESMTGGAGQIGLESGEELSFRQPHISLKVLKNLKQGKYAIQSELDLHGLTANEARGLLREFLTEVQLQGHRCVRIVHGKGLRSGSGGPVLKVKLNKWLPQWDQVLAFASAPPRDGGTGALYVLLAR